MEFNKGIRDDDLAKLGLAGVEDDYEGFKKRCKAFFQDLESLRNEIKRSPETIDRIKILRDGLVNVLDVFNTKDLSLLPKEFLAKRISEYKYVIVGINLFLDQIDQKD